MDKWFSSKIIDWYRQNRRNLPWRNETDPYRIWLSEIILQQTQVVQGLPYYHRFIETFPAISHLAAAKEDEVLKLWQGLGYYSRARNLHAAAKQVMAAHNGVFPSDYPSIRALKGVGDYTAAAIGSFAFNIPRAVVDGNVYRLLSRVFGIKTPIDSTKGKKQFAELATRLLNARIPGLHNQAMMEFGSQYCRPRNPDCLNCTLQTKCRAYASGTVEKLPVKHKKINVKKRHFNYLVVCDGTGNVLIKRRQQKDIWQGLYDFPLVETAEEAGIDDLKQSRIYKTIGGGGKNLIICRSRPYKHVLSHQVLLAKFYVLQIKKVKPAEGFIKTRLNELEQYGMPVLIQKYLNDGDLKEIIKFDQFRK